MSLPRLNRRLTLETPVKSPDGAGGYTVTWSALGVHWAAAQPRSGRERAVGDAPTSTVPYKITVRAAPVDSLARPKPEQRFRDGARIYLIKSVSEVDGKDLYLMCTADEEIIA